MIDQAQVIDQANKLSALSVKEHKLLAQTVFVQYDQPFKVLFINRDNNKVVVRAELQDGRKVSVRL